VTEPGFLAGFAAGELAILETRRCQADGESHLSRRSQGLLWGTRNCEAGFRRLIHVRGFRTVTLAAGILVLAGCGDEAPAAKTQSGVTGLVHVGPQCPVETAGDPCEDQPAEHVNVTLFEALPGDSSAASEVVARATTNADGTYRIVVAPGDYVVTADAGMSCQLMDARVTTAAYAKVDIPCDTGIR
jgi:hypothetical protein